ncbi:MAG: bacillithiol biosynthesis deacetylase BshB1 [Planctomycetota bacterium]
MLDVLAVSPHPDDVELAMGGSLLLMKSEGLRVGILDLTNGEPTPQGSPEIRAREAACAAQVLGLDLRITLDLPNRWLVDDKPARIKVAEVLREHEPPIVFLPYWVDSHPDHVAAAQLVVAAIFTARLTKDETIHGRPYRARKFCHYIATHMNISPSPSFSLDVSPFFERKMQVVSCYKSQFGDTPLGSRVIPYVTAMARYWGAMIGVEYAEPFVTREEIGLKSLRDLL